MARKREVLPPTAPLHYLAKQFSVCKPMIKQRSSFVILPISNDLF